MAQSVSVPSAIFPRMVRLSGAVPICSAAAQLSNNVTNSHAAALASTALARHGECDTRRFREAVEEFAVVPNFFRAF